MTSAPSYRWPRRNTKRFAMLLMQLSGIRMAHMSVLAESRTYRAAAVVLALKKAGFPSDAELQTVYDVNGHATRIACYFIPAGKLGDVLADGHRKGGI